MWPRLYTLTFGSLQIPINSFGLMFMTGFLLATGIAVRRGKPLGYDGDGIMDLGIVLMLGGILGARINYILVEPEQFRESMRLFDLGDGGLSFAGAIGFGLVPLVLRWRRGKAVGACGSASVGASKAPPPAVDAPTLPPSRHPTIKPDAPRKSPLCGLLSLWVFTILAALAGARAVHVALHREAYDFEIVKIWNGGIVLYGGVILAIVAGIVYARRKGIAILRTADLIIPVLFIGLLFGRIGCFLNGCCFGAVCSPEAETLQHSSLRAPKVRLPGAEGLCVRFPGVRPGLPPSPAWARQRQMGLIPGDAKESLPVYPTQLFESAAALLIFFAISWLWRRKTFDGQTLCQAGLLYPPWRFFNEMLRDDTDPFRLAGVTLTFSQWVSLAVFALAIVAYVVLKSLAAARPTAPAA